MLLAHWRLVAVGALVAATVTLFVSWRAGIEEAAAAQALAEAAQQRLDARLDSLRVLEEARALSDSIAAQALAWLESTRQEAAEATTAARRAMDTAQAHVDAVLDSARAEQPDVALVVEEAVEVERQAKRSVIDGLRVQLSAADSTAALWRSRHTDAMRVIDAQVMALEEAQAALAARIAQNQGRWSDRAVRVLKYAGVFAAGYALAKW